MAFSLPEDDAYSRNKGWLLDRITIAMGGYAAEKIMLNETTTGAAERPRAGHRDRAQDGLRVGDERSARPHRLRPEGRADLPRQGDRAAQGLLRGDGARHRHGDQEDRRGLPRGGRAHPRGAEGQAEAPRETLLVKENMDDDEIRALLGLPAEQAGRVSSPAGVPRRRTWSTRWDRPLSPRADVRERVKRRVSASSNCSSLSFSSLADGLSPP